MTPTSDDLPEGPRPVQPTVPSNLTGVPDSAALGSTLTTAGSPFSAAPTTATSAQRPEKVKVRGPLLKLMISMLVANFSIFAIWGAVPGILLPIQIEGIVGSADKQGAFGLVSVIGAFAAMIAQPIAGLVSDRTRSRFGRRAPWMVAGVLLGGLSLLFMGASNGIVQLAVAWVMVQICFNFAQGPLSAILPDRVPSGARGTFASFSGFGLMLGSLGGSIIASRFIGAIPAGYLTFAGIALVVIVLFVVLNPDKSTKSAPKPAFDVVVFLRTFWVSPRKHPDFFWGFTGRLLLYAGYFMVTGYQLYILQDYIGLGAQGAGNFVPIMSLVSLVAILIATVIGGPLSDKLGRRKIVVIVAGVVLAVSLVFPWIMPTTTGMLIFAFVSGLGFGAYQSVDTALMSEVLPSKDDFAKDLGVLNIAATLPQTLAPGLATLIFLVFGYVGLFPIGIVIALLGAFAVLPIKSVR
ncbi:MAG: MFS transporter [Leifsonia sp. 71-9]|nr:MAG: MFS transporter [Leifsonia sp. 71-9]